MGSMGSNVFIVGFETGRDGGIPESYHSVVFDQGAVELLVRHYMRSEVGIAGAKVEVLSPASFRPLEVWSFDGVSWVQTVRSE